MIEIEPHNASDMQFVLACQNGDLDAFSVLYTRHAPTVLRYAWSRLDDRSLAEEVLQETFVTAWAKRKKSSIVDASLLPWLLTICRNHISNQTRRRSRHHALHTDTAPELTSTDRSNLSVINDALAKLSEIDRLVCELCLIDGLTYKQAADQLGSTPAAVGKRLQRARAQLRDTLTDDGI